MAPTVAAPPPVNDMGTFQVIPLSLIDFCKSNPRKSFDKHRLDELAQSIREKGLIEAIVVRPKGQRFEVVAGERRVRAARLAGLAGIKAESRELSDEDVLELQVIENLQRDDVHPLDEAGGYQALMAMNPAKHTPEHIAAAVGKSVSYIYQRLRLLALIGKLQKLFREGEIGPAHAILLARLQPKDQGRALEDVFRYNDVTVGRVREWIERTVLLDLKKAPFDTADAQLVPAAGACLSCPKRTGCAPALFEDIKSGDTCTDPGCYGEKRSASLARAFAGLQAKHGADAVAAVSPGDGFTGNEQKAIAAAWPHALGENRFTLAGTDKCDHTRIALVISEGRYGRHSGLKVGDTKQVCVSPKTCQVHRERFDSSRGLPVNNQQREKDRKHRHEQKVWTAAKTAIFDAVMAKVNAITVGDLRLFAEAAFDRAHFDGQKMLVPMIGWDAEAWRKNRSTYPAKQIATMTEPALRRLLYAAALAGEFTIPTWSWGGKGKSDQLEALAARWKVPAEAIEKKVRAAMPLAPKPGAKRKAAAAKKAAPAKAAKKAKKR